MDDCPQIIWIGTQCCDYCIKMIWMTSGDVHDCLENLWIGIQTCGWLSTYWLNRYADFWITDDIQRCGWLSTNYFDWHPELWVLYTNYLDDIWRCGWLPRKYLDCHPDLWMTVHTLSGFTSELVGDCPHIKGIGNLYLDMESAIEFKVAATTDSTATMCTNSLHWHLGLHDCAEIICIGIWSCWQLSTNYLDDIQRCDDCLQRPTLHLMLNQFIRKTSVMTVATLLQANSTVPLEQPKFPHQV